MAHFHDAVIQRPNKFNFAVDVVDYWAAQPGDLQAMYWVSKEESQTRSMTFQYFSRQSHRISVLLRQLGVKEGETTVMVVPRVPAWWEIAVACIRSGIILAPATVLLTDKDIQYRCAKSKASMFIGDGASIAKFLAVRDQCPLVRTILQVGDAPHKSVIPFYAALENIEADATVKDVRRKWNSPALLYFTSGTSGPPKMVRHNQISYPLALTITAKFWYQLAPGKLFWNTAEQGWAKAAWSFFGAWNCGATLFVYDDRGPFSPLRLLRILHRYPVTTICAAPLAYRQLVLQDAKAYYEKYPPKLLSHCTAAGEALNGEVITQWRNITGMEIRDGYGQTESILLCGNFSAFPIRPGSMGKPAPTVPLSVITRDGSEAAVGEEGDMAVLIHDISGSKSFFGIFDGYVNDDNTISRQEKTFTNNGEKKVWYLTGDKARRDQDGYFWFVGRSDDVINSSGYRIGPFEVESTLKLHSSVAESAVISSPDPIRGEVVKAFVVLTEQFRDANKDALRKELQDFCKTHAAPYKYPRKIQFVHAGFFPRTVSGKIQRNELRKLEWRNEAKAKL
ncbi:hypothetical protein OIDMADRAFT_61086 [Oidiodendron maius Zn]|uniref:medium-chain acyl-CoA ligase n=1 Tax=Oidiodendron maius (strain Zn) TaxID=913774 RepID=A0A0C3GR48_OIDMZ|nr:hypothetical protein OIDMADRAFT_61086 [Oidiodendron maius Zn]